MERYIQGYQDPRLFDLYERQAERLVWTELISYGHSIRDEPLYTDAKAVAWAMMRRARKNVELLVARLHTLNYRFAYPDHVWTQPDEAVVRRLDALEHQTGPWPILLRAWFEVVGAVNLMGSHPKLNTYTDLDQDQPLNELLHSDPLVVWSRFFDRGNLIPHNDVYDHFYAVPIAPDLLHKAGESGDTPMSICVPNGMFDAPLIDPGAGWTGAFFVQHLQTSFEWGGFPGLRNTPAAAAEATAELAFLRQGLLPLI